MYMATTNWKIREQHSVLLQHIQRCEEGRMGKVGPRWEKLSMGNANPEFWVYPSTSQAAKI